jgi:hypothetical protein
VALVVTLSLTYKGEQMRPIKFRAWATKEKEMLYPEQVEVPGRHPELLTLMQFTGLLDKNGKEIYEKDIVKHEEYKGEYHIYPIDSLEWFFFNHGNSDSLAGWSSDRFEVIGNCFENPELLDMEDRGDDSGKSENTEHFEVK